MEASCLSCGNLKQTYLWVGHRSPQPKHVIFFSISIALEGLSSVASLHLIYAPCSLWVEVRSLLSLHIKLSHQVLNIVRKLVRVGLQPRRRQHMVKNSRKCFTKASPKHVKENTVNAFHLRGPRSILGLETTFVNRRSTNEFVLRTASEHARQQIQLFSDPPQKESCISWTYSWNS